MRIINKVLKKKPLTCYHCGDVCTTNSIHIDAKVFCCNGCKMVYELLEEKSLCDYYALETKPGNKVSQPEAHALAYLDDEKIKNSLLTFQEGNISGVTFHIPAIHCSSCIWLLENLNTIHAGILTSTIQFHKKQLDIQFDTSITLRELARLLISVGYPPSITLNGQELSNQVVNKALYYKLGIAGFCFGNIMMLSLPEYLSVFDDFAGSIRHLFTWLSLLLALPVFLYSASDYFISSWNAIKTRIINIDLPIAIGLVTAFAQSAYEIITGTGSGYLDSLSGLVFFLLIGKWYQQKTYQALSFDRDYKSYFPLAAAKIEGGKECFVPLHELQKGDTIVVRNQEIIPADGFIVHGDANINYSFVTGETLPVPKSKGEQVFSGGKQQGASIQIQLTREVSESYLTQLWNKDHTKPKVYGLTDFTNKTGKYFTFAVLIISSASYLYWIDKDPSLALYAAVSVLIIFCPCTLALAIPFCFGNAMNILGKNGFFLKNADTIEKLATSDTVIFDKTGTITSVDEAEIIFYGALTPLEKQLVKSLVDNSTHPLSRMLSAYLSSIVCLKPDTFTEIPSEGISGTFGDLRVKIGSSTFAKPWEDKLPDESSQTRVFININGHMKGYYVFSNKYRSLLTKTLLSLQKKFSIHLLSGDNDSEKKYLSNFFKSSQLHFNQSPTDKLAYVKSLAIQHKVMMIGDGLNDAGALLASDCAISITENSSNFSPACDAILEASQFAKLPDFMAYARACLKTVYWSLAVSLTYNITGLFFAVQGNLKPLVAAIIMPLSSVSVVLFVTWMSNYHAKKYKLL